VDDQIQNANSGISRVLVVDDEPVARQQLVFQLAQLNHQVTAVASSADAQDILTREGSEAFDCLITDCWMPGSTGLDLLLWLRQHDLTLASIVISQSTDKDLIKQSFRGGASDFLNKPVSAEELGVAMKRTIQSTHRRRDHAATGSEVKQAGLVQRRMNNLGLAGELPTSLKICYYPHHDAGGDSVAFFSLDETRILVVVADVSGHSLKSAFISAYFQGVLRGMVELGVSMTSILNRFNRFLTHEWLESNEDAGTGQNGDGVSVDHDHDSSPEITSLAVCSALIDLSAGSVSLLNSGFPIPNRVDGNGRPWPCGVVGGYPIGWFDPNPLSELTITADPSDYLVLWTDGLEDFAHQLGIGEWSLAFKILQVKEKRRTPDWLKGTPDDVLMVVIGLNKESKEITRFPVMREIYHRGQIDQIDELQETWRRNLAFAFPQLEVSRLFDILLCTREGVLNGLLHGCPLPSDRCELVMIFNSAVEELQIEITDSGPGHHFDPETCEGGEFRAQHRGLMLIRGLPDRVEQNSKGAAIQMVFLLSPKPEVLNL